MTVYIVTCVTLAILGIIYEGSKLAAIDLNKKIPPAALYIVPSFTLVFFVSAFRGDMNNDYENYTRIFHEINSYEFSHVFTHGPDLEFLFVLLNRVIGLFTDNEIFFFGITSFIILYGLYHQFNKYSVKIWLSVLLFVAVGSYYASFNIVRQIMAVIIIFMGSKFLYDRNFLKYMLVILIATLVHKSSIFMIPFYFILNFRINLRNLIFISVGAVISVVFFDPILSFSQNFLYGNYDEDTYGMTGQSFKNVVLPVAFLVFSILNIKKLDPDNNMHRVWFNATFFYALFDILALQILMVERLGHYFAPYVFLLIPFIFSKMQDKYLRFVYTMGLIFMVILYNYVTLSGDAVFDPYYFFWEM